MDKQILKLHEEHLIALIRGTNIAIVVQGVYVEILPPVYDANDRYKHAFEAGQEFPQQATLYLSLQDAAQ